MMFLKANALGIFEFVLSIHQLLIFQRVHTELEGRSASDHVDLSEEAIVGE